MNKLNKIFKISILICLIVSFLSFVGCAQIEKIRKDFLKEAKTGKEIPLESTKISEELKLESEQILNLCFNEEPLTIDPNLANSRASINIINQIFVGLTKLEPDLSVSPCIAENWEISDDGTIITFTIREDAYWTNGDNITAHDFVYSWKRTLSPEINSPHAYLFFDIEGAKEFNKGELDSDALGIEAKSDNVLEIKLKGPVNYFTYITSTWITKPVPESVVEKYKENWTNIKNLVTNGPFILKNWEHDEKIVLKANPNYFEGSPKLNTINIFLCKDKYTELSVYEEGKIDGTWGWQSGIPSDKLEEIISTPLIKSQLLTEPRISTYYIGFNTRHEPGNNPLIRKAIALAINKNELKNNIFWKNQTVANQFTPSQVLGHDETIGIDFDVEKAKKILVEALQPTDESSNNKGNRPLKFVYEESEENEILVKSIKSMLSKNLNLEVDLIEMDSETYFDTIHDIYGSTIVIDMYLMEKIPDYPHVSNWLFIELHSRSPNNYTGWKNDEFDELVTNAVIFDDLDKQVELYKKASKIAFGDKSDEDKYPGEFPIVPLYYGSRNILIRPWVKGYQSNPFTGPYFYTVWIEK
ncbi:unnamed protein product [marine sediment metagenome]|uniref:Solute-binding protein family 5 domain-containing protein n=2 Tax=marine sediment metagenome TaxID=412755 RepID=X0ZLX9_9ZZZZ